MASRRGTASSDAQVAATAGQHACEYAREAGKRVAAPSLAYRVAVAWPMIGGRFPSAANLKFLSFRRESS
jgi:hypothetical protein